MECLNFTKELEEIKSLKCYDNIDQNQSDTSIQDEVNACVDVLAKQYDICKALEKKLISDVDANWNEESELLQKKESIDLKVQDLRKSNETLLQELKGCEMKKKEVAEEVTAAKSLHLKLTEQRVIGDRRDKSAYDLLKNVTRIKWNLPCNGETLQGAVVSNSEIKPFSFNLKESTDAQITAQLWSMMDEGNHFKL